MKKVTKAVIPTAGLGTRFLPATKSIPKELLTLVDKPILLYIVEEILAAGIEDIVLVTGRGKYAIEDFFDRTYELEDKLEKAGKLHLLGSILNVRDRANFIFIRQKDPKGLGHAVLCSEPIVGNEPFAVLLGDEIMVGEPATTELLCETYGETETSTIAIMEVAQSEVSKYGIASVTQKKGRVYNVSAVVEKPSKERAPSRWALPGRYVFNPKIFSHIKSTQPGVGGEIQLTDAIHALAQKGEMLASTFNCKRFDAGDKLGFLQANVELALSHPEVGEGFKKYLTSLVPQLR